MRALPRSGAEHQHGNRVDFYCVVKDPVVRYSPCIRYGGGTAVAPVDPCDYVVIGGSGSGMLRRGSVSISSTRWSGGTREGSCPYSTYRRKAISSSDSRGGAAGSS